MLYVRGFKIARQFASPMLSRTANKKEVEHASNAALLSVARLKASLLAGLALAASAAGSGKSGLALNAPPRGSVEESPESVVADVEQEPEGVPFGKYAALPG